MKIIQKDQGCCDGEIFNIGNPANEATVKDLAFKLRDFFINHPSTKHYERHSDIVEVTSKEYYGDGYQDIQARVPSIRKAKALLDWEPKVDLDTALQKTLAYYLDGTMRDK